MLAPVPAIDVVDSTWLRAEPQRVAAAVRAGDWSSWWPGLELSVSEDRGLDGVRWTVPTAPDGMAGSAEVWLQAVRDGTVAHFFLRLDPTSGRTVSDRERDRVARRYRELTKAVFWTLGDSLDPGRLQRMTTSTAARTPPSDGTWQINW